MLKFFKNLKKSENSSIINNSISFDLDSDGKVHFNINLLDESKESAEKLGLMLFMINEGHYIQHILSSLDSLTKDPLSSHFAQQVIKTWSQHISKEEKDQEKPIISPSSFNIK